MNTSAAAEEEDRFETSQTVVAAFFYYSGLEVLEIVWQYGRGTFYFTDTPELHELLESFIKGEARVEPQGFNNAYGEVKNWLFKVRDETVQQGGR